MRDRDNEIGMLQDTLQILEQGCYEKNGKKVKLKLSRKEMETIMVLLPDDVKDYSSRPEFKPPYLLGGRCGHGCENMDSYTLARRRLRNTYLFGKDDQKILVLNLANPVHSRRRCTYGCKSAGRRSVQEEFTAPVAGEQDGFKILSI